MIESQMALHDGVRYERKNLTFFVSFCYSNQVRELETDPLFNSGRGSALTAEGTVEMEASIMDGNGRRCGAVSGLTTVKNPVSLARLVMEKSPHSYLAFSGAEDFARQQVFFFFLPFYFYHIITEK